jgi:hypothetical protein
MRAIIGRALAEPEFRERLIRDPGIVLAGHDLTEGERAALSDLSEDAFDALAAGLEGRVSKMSPLAGFGALKRYGTVQMEEGAVALDQDWNEDVAILEGASDPETVVRTDPIDVEDIVSLLERSDDD